VHQPVLPDSEAKRYVVDLRVGERVDTTFLLRRCDLRTRQGGEPYLALQLGDKSGNVPGRMWDNAAAAAGTVCEGDYVRVVGAVETWQSSPQIKVERLEPADRSQIDAADYLPVSSRDRDEMYDELLRIVGTVENPHLRELLTATFADPAVADTFRRAPGGVVLHHAYVGGLLEHTLSVVGLAMRVAEHYPALDRDLLVTGACLHDLGKIWELAYEQAFDYTEEGRLVGHLLLESNWLATRMDAIDGFPAPLRHHVLHLLASHHGIHEHGAPVMPATPEALALHYVDDLDSKMGAMDAAIAEAAASGATTVYSRSLGRRVLRRRWNEVED
jgi:3'-5' exoribonuclease